MFFYLHIHIITVSFLDIQFWNSRQSLEGLSVRSIIFGVFQSLVVLLYILDNETNFVVQVSVFIGLLIDLWKITKVMDVKVSWTHAVFIDFFFLSSSYFPTSGTSSRGHRPRYILTKRKLEFQVCSSPCIIHSV